MKVGDRVRLTREVQPKGRREKAYIMRFMSDAQTPERTLPTGGVVLRPALDGFFSWNIKDLERC